MTTVPGSSIQEFDFIFQLTKMKQTFVKRIMCRVSQKTDIETKKASILI